MIDLFENEIIINDKPKTLADKFIMCPTSVLNMREGKWRRLKYNWLKLGIKSEKGREVRDTIKAAKDPMRYEYMRNMKGFKSVSATYGAYSIFDPVLCEIAYKWFCPSNGSILDPFAGGSVRGIVAHELGYNYTGIELRQEQVDANRINALEVCNLNNQPQWYCGDSDEILSTNFNKKFDLLFTCPPYMGLEVYSKLPADISNMNDIEFTIKYNSIINKACNMIKPNGYAAIVVGYLRDKKGMIKDFPQITKEAFRLSGFHLYNEIILIENFGSKAIAAGRIFKSGKVSKTHSMLLIFKRS